MTLHSPTSPSHSTHSLHQLEASKHFAKQEDSKEGFFHEHLGSSVLALIVQQANDCGKKASLLQMF